MKTLGGVLVATGVAEVPHIRSRMIWTNKNWARKGFQVGFLGSFKLIWMVYIPRITLG